MTEKEQNSVFQDWFKQHQALFYKVVRAYAFNTADRDDLLQEIAVQAWRSVPKFRHESAVSTWLYRIALNTAIKWNKREKKHQNDGTSPDQLICKSQTPEDPRLAWMYEQIAKLDEVDRSVTLLMLDGFSYQEMAGILGISESNIGVKIHRIKKHLINQSKEYET